MTDARQLQGIRIEVSAARGASFADIARRTGMIGGEIVLRTDTDQQVLDKQVALATEQSESASLSATAAAGFVGGILYPTTAAGLAAVVANAYFTVAGDGTTTYADLYRKVSGAAVLVASYLSKAGFEAANVVLEANLNQVLARDVEGDTWGAPKALDFSSPDFMVPGTPAGFVVTGTATASVNASGELEVVKPYGDTTGRVFASASKMGEGVLRIVVARDSQWMVEIAHTDFVRHAVYYEGGTSVSYGYVDASGTRTAYGSTPIPSAPAGTAIVVEVVRGPFANNLVYAMRAWIEGATPPALTIITQPNTPAQAVNEGMLSISSFTGAGATKIKRIEMIDGRYGCARSTASAAFIGRWFPRYEGGAVVQSTTRAGSRIRLRATATTTVGIRWAVPYVASNPPIADVYLNGARTGTTVTFSGSAGTIGSTTAVSGLDAGKVYQIELRVRGVHEHNDKWLSGSGLQIEGFTCDAGGRLQPWADDRPKALFNGDSITEGILARGPTSTPANSGGDVSYPSLFCDAKGLQPVINGFGGTGMTVAGSGGMPKAETNSFAYMNDRPIDTLAENIKFIFINQGTNDGFASVSTATFQAAYLALVEQLLRQHPGALGIYCMRPLNGSYATQISAVVTQIGQSRVRYLDTTGWTASIAYTDMVHPTVAGHATIAGLLGTAVGDMRPEIG